MREKDKKDIDVKILLKGELKKVFKMLKKSFSYKKETILRGV